MFEVITFLLLSGLVALIAGIYFRVTAMSFSLVLSVGLYSLKDLLPLDASISLLPIIIATSLASSIPLNLFALIKSSRSDNLELENMTRSAAKIALLVVIVAQLVGILPKSVIHILFAMILLILAGYYLLPVKLLMRVAESVNRFFPKLLPIMLLGFLPVLGGNEGHEVHRFISNEIKPKQGFNSKYFLMALFICLAASIGFAFPAFPLIDIFSTAGLYQDSGLFDINLMAGFFGYIYLPMALYLGVIGFIGWFFVRKHDSEIDALWLKKAFALFILGLLLRELVLFF